MVVRLSLQLPALALVPLVMITACGGGGGEDNASDQEESENVLTYDGDDRRERIEAGAAEEGSLTWYTSLAGPVVSAVADEFERLYPDVTVHVFRAGSSDLTTRIIQEMAADRIQADVFEISTGASLMRELGVQAPFYTPYAEDIPAEWKEVVDGNVIGRAAVRASYNSFGYNSDLLDPALIPETLEDLANPALASQMAITNSGTSVEWVGLMHLTLGDEEASAQVKAMLDAGMRVESVSGSALAGLVASGEVVASPSIVRNHVRQYQDEGAPIEWVPLKPTKLNVGWASVAKGTRHPNAALLFMDYLLGEEGKQVMSDMHYPAPYEPLPFDQEIIDPNAEYETTLDYQEAYNTWLDEITVGGS